MLRKSCSRAAFVFLFFYNNEPLDLFFRLNALLFRSKMIANTMATAKKTPSPITIAMGAVANPITLDAVLGLNAAIEFCASAPTPGTMEKTEKSEINIRVSPGALRETTNPL
jgi:hypothetical protein